MQAVRLGNYKGIQITNIDGKKSFELYDLSKDPGENLNVAENHPKIVRRLQKEMDQAFEYSADYDRLNISK